MSFDPTRDYPLGSRRPAGQNSARDARARPETLRRQAEVASAARRQPLAERLERAAELTLVPGERRRPTNR